MDAAIDFSAAARAADLDGLAIRRVLPLARRRSVGPFVFLDHIGPTDFPPGAGFDVPPHPHIGLATVTYLFSGEILHRDSLGYKQAIRPGDVNWMVAGSGIVHSERTRAAIRSAGQHLHGLQCWLALPQTLAECDPTFSHFPASQLPEMERPGVRLRLILGSALGLRSPVPVASPTFYLVAECSAGADLPVPADHAERAGYIVSGEVEADGQIFGAGALLVVKPGADLQLKIHAAGRVALFGGDPLDGPRLMWWNFVAASRERLARAREDWSAGRFPPIPGEGAGVPLPESGH